MTHNIRSEIIQHQHHISVMGLLDAQEEQQQLLQFLNQREDIEEIHITFFETKFLPTTIIEALKCHLDKFPHIPLKLFILHRHLSLYLSSLGIQNRLVFEKSLTSSPSTELKP